MKIVSFMVYVIAIAATTCNLFLNYINPRAIALLYFVQHVEKISLFVLSISVVLTQVVNRASYGRLMAMQLNNNAQTIDSFRDKATRLNEMDAVHFSKKQ